MNPALVPQIPVAVGNVMREFWRWWTTGLKASWSILTGFVRHRPRPQNSWRIILGEKELSIDSEAEDKIPEGEQTPSLSLNHPSPDTESFFKSALRGATEADLFIDTANVLIRDLRYPRVAADEMHQILTLELDKRTPFSAEQAHFTFRILEDDLARREVLVRLYAVSRAMVSRAVSALERLDVRTRSALIEDGGFASPIWRSDSVSGQLWSTKTRIWAGICLILLVANMVLPLRMVGSSVQRLEGEVEKLSEVVLKDSQIRIADSLRMRNLNELVSTYNHDLAISEVLRELNERLPLHAYLTTIRVEGTTVTVTGESTAHDVVAEAIDASPYFYELAFQLIDAPGRPDSHRSFSMNFKTKPQ